MKRETKTVWTDNNGGELLTFIPPAKYYIPLGTVGEATLRELGKAIQDALSEPVVSAIRNAGEKDHP